MDHAFGAGRVFFPDWIAYIYRPNSLYNRRFEQRRRLKELPGCRHRHRVERAKYRRHTKPIFLESLSAGQASAIRPILGVELGEFWRACRGEVFLDLAPRTVQLELPLDKRKEH